MLETHQVSLGQSESLFTTHTRDIHLRGGSRRHEESWKTSLERKTYEHEQNLRETQGGLDLALESGVRLELGLGLGLGGELGLRPGPEESSVLSHDIPGKVTQAQQDAAIMVRGSRRRDPLTLLEHSVKAMLKRIDDIMEESDGKSERRGKLLLLKV